jgi:RNA polymerase sigma factor (sigma-70 family)
MSCRAPWTEAGRPSSRPEDGRPHLHVLTDDRYADWEGVYRDNVDRLYRLMYARVGNRPDAEDLTAEVFRAALGPLRLDVSKGEARAYLLMTAQTVLASHWRRRLGQPVTFLDPATDLDLLSDSPAAENLGSKDSQQVARILAALPERYRRILELRFLEASSIKEAAGIMDISVANAKVLQHRALRMAAKLAAEVEQ